MNRLGDQCLDAYEEKYPNGCIGYAEPSDIVVIDFWNNDSINNITDEERSLYLVDHIHPTKAGYKLWWLPEIRKTLYEVVK
mgnify:CR=1 FL=1